MIKVFISQAPGDLRAMNLDCIFAGYKSAISGLLLFVFLIFFQQILKMSL